MPKAVEHPRERKVTARFTPEEVERLRKEAKRRREPISSLVRELVVQTLDEVAAKVRADKRR